MRRLKRRSRIGQVLKALRYMTPNWQSTFSVWSSNATAPGAPGNPTPRTGNEGDGFDSDNPYGVGGGREDRRREAHG